MTTEFQIGDRVLWPNGVEGRVAAIDASDNTVMDECGGWHKAMDVDFAPVFTDPTYRSRLRDEAGDEAAAMADAFLDANPDCAF